MERSIVLFSIFDFYENKPGFYALFSFLHKAMWYCSYAVLGSRIYCSLYEVSSGHVNHELCYNTRAIQQTTLFAFQSKLTERE